MKISRKKIKIKNITQLIVAFAIIILVNYIGSVYFFRQDLTSEKRFTLTNYSKKIISESKDIIYIQIFLEGDLPTGFIRLKNSVKELLDEFRILNKKNIQYEFINPSESNDKKTKGEIYTQLYKKGLMPTNLKEKDKEGKVSEKIIFPGAIINYKNKEIAINLLKNNPAASPEQNLNNSIQDLEYLFISSINKVSASFKQRIAIIEGNGEYNDLQINDITNSLLEFYSVKRVTIKNQLSALKDFDAIIIAGSDSIFNEKDKFIIDQFIMNGGKALWAINAVEVSMDSLAYSSSTLALVNILNIEDQLFRYGARINPNLVLDLQCGVIPVNTSVTGDQPQFKPAGWFYFPLITTSNNHEINKNINMVKADFISSVDTTGEDSNIKKTVLLKSSKYSRIINAPARVSLDIIKQEPNPDMYNMSEIHLAVLLEGKFTSLFKNRIPSEIANDKKIGFNEISKPTKMIVIGDADIIKNAIKIEGKKSIPYPLGYDRYTGQTFGNKEFILNSINYLLDDSGLLSIRSRVISLRLLDRAKILEERTYWQTLNILLPIFFVFIVGIAIIYFRKRKYSK